MKVAQLINENFLGSLEKLRVQKLPLKASYQIAGISKKVREEFGRFEEARKNALEQLAEKDEAGNPIVENGSFKLDKEGLKELSRQLKEVVELEIDVQKIKLSDLGDLSKVELSAQDVEILEAIIEP
jgi:hypothetical protein